MADPVWLNGQNVSQNSSSVAELEASGGSLEALGHTSQVFLVCLYSLTAFLAFAGNITVILVELFGKRTANNLRKLLINLATTDVLNGEKQTLILIRLN